MLLLRLTVCVRWRLSGLETPLIRICAFFAVEMSKACANGVKPSSSVRFGLVPPSGSICAMAKSDSSAAYFNGDRTVLSIWSESAPPSMSICIRFKSSLLDAAYTSQACPTLWGAPILKRTLARFQQSCFASSGSWDRQASCS